MKNFLTNLNSLNVPFTLNLSAGVGFKNGNGGSCFANMQYYNAPFDIPWDTSNCESMFHNCRLFNVPLNLIEESPITSMYRMLDNCYNFDQELVIPTTCESFSGVLNGDISDGVEFTSNVHLYSYRSSPYAIAGGYESGFSGSYRFNGNVIFYRPVVNLSYFFSSCHALNRTQYIPRGVENICSMYYGCINFNSPLSFPNTVQDASYVFSGCHSLRTSINLPDNINAYQAYSYCFNFNSPIRIPNNSNIAFMFYDCTNYNQPTYVPQFVNDVNVYSGGDSLFYWCENLNSPITFADGIKYLFNTFRRCSHLNSEISLPSGLLTMDNTFIECTCLNRSITIPSSVTNMHHTFQYCSSLNAHITLPSSLQSMVGTFRSCSNFNKPITIPSGVKDASMAFYQCYNFNQGISLPSGIKSISSMCSGCYNLVGNINIPSSVNDCSGAFYETSVLNVNIHSAQISYAGSIKNVITAWRCIDTHGKTPSTFNVQKFYNGDYFNYDNYRRLSWGDYVGVIRINAQCEVTQLNNMNLYDAYRNNSNYSPHNIVGGNGIYLNYSQYSNRMNNITNEETKQRYNHGRLFQLDYSYINVETNTNFYDYRVLYFDYPNARSDYDCPVYWYKVEWI